MSGRLEGKVALVTGSASGLGAATTARFALEGATVVGLDLDESPAAKESHVASVTDEDAVAQVVRSIVDGYGRLDVVANFAGTAGGGPVHWLDRSEWDRVMSVNVTGTYLVNKHALVPMLEQRSGSIINVASIVALVGAATSQIGYTASKGAVLSLTRELAVQFARQGIRVNALCPGVVETPLLLSIYGSDPAALERRRIHWPTGRLATPREIVNAALFLASDESSFVNGATFVVDGGLTAAYVTPE